MTDTQPTTPGASAGPYQPAQFTTQAPAAAAYAPRTNGLATAAMILGICGIVFCFAGIGTLAMVVLAVTFGAISLRKANRGAPNKGFAVTGLTCGLVGVFVYFVVGVASHGWLFLI